MEQVSSALEDVKEIVESRPELSQEEWETVEKAIPWVKSTLKPEIRKELEVEYAKKNAEFQDEIKLINQSYINEKLEEMRKARDPLSKDELDRLLSQEYSEYPCKLLKDGKEVTFIIRELPNSVEDKFVKTLKQYLIPMMQDKENLQFQLEGSMLDRISVFIDGSSPAMKMAAELVSIVLNPWGKDNDITPEWVKENLSTFRMSAIIFAQFEANKYRDFLFQGFQTFQSLRQS